ncbi:glutamate-tRNA ligase [Exophiala mesophila]|uniref:Glutamate--tRNA ligase, mitochondrial n=1 Tax=Exophiala mesophila TaxID=212818 RepID=A0A0D1WQL7_EXOME|nr:glutamate-tRNA ligase [Exophiala mesophila]KIV91395.1 glutamate-tRNA ligase [Exophiala mesophila]
MTRTLRSPRATGWVCNACRHRTSTLTTLPLRHWTSSRQSSSSASSPKSKIPDPKASRFPTYPARTRFAPSPTGDLHLGSIRTALFNYLLAKATKGQFLLRIEDTDAKRTIPGAEDRLYRDLRWAGLDWDEGPVVGGPYGPYKQSERLAQYQSHIQDLLKTSHAYRCFCTPERIDELNRRRHDKGLSPGYDRKCTHLSSAEVAERVHKGEPHVIRFRAPEKWPRVKDLTFGWTGHGEKKSKNLHAHEPAYDDSVLIKSDGFPTYHWANICDDRDMKITHVIRGSEWLSSTPLHVALYNALNWTPPAFVHVPLLFDTNNQKLSKRNFDSDVSSYRSNGFFPEALLNFAALLGWSHKEKSDCMDLDTLISLFDLKITKNNCVVTFKKLDFLQAQHASRHIEAGGEKFEQMIRDTAVAVLEKYGAAAVQSFIGTRSLRDVLAQIMSIKSIGYSTAPAFAEKLAVFFEPLPSPLPPPPVLSHDQTWLLHALRVAASTLLLVPAESWNQETHRSNLLLLQENPYPGLDTTTTTTSTDSPSSELPADSTVLTSKQWRILLYHYLRWALLAGRNGPGIPETLELLGPEVCRQRIQEANQRSQEFQVESVKPILEEQGWKGDADGKRRVEKAWTPHALNASPTPPTPSSSASS